MTVLDDKLVPKVLALIAKLGVSASIIKNSTAYDPVTGDVATVAGTIDGALASVVEEVWDRVSELTIDVASGTFTDTTSSEIDVLNGDNRIKVNSEIIGFATVETLVADSKFKLTNLLRGTDGTAVAAHADNDPWTSSLEVTTAIMMTPPSAYAQRYIDGDLIREHDFKSLVAGSGLAITPLKGDVLVFGTERFTLVKVDPIYSGEQIAAYKMQLRQ